MKDRNMDFVWFLIAMYVHSLGYSWGMILVGFFVFCGLLFLGVIIAGWLEI